MENANNKKQTFANSLAVKIIMYVCCVGLIGFYLLVLWWGMHPAVPIEYKMYYLTHELIDWPGYDNLSYKLGTKEFCYGKPNEDNAKSEFPINQRKGTGWYTQMMEGLENQEDEAIMYYIPTSSADSTTYTVQVKEFKGDGELEIFFDDKSIGKITKEGTFTLDAGSVEKDKLLKVTFVSKNCRFKLWSLILS